MFNKGANDNTNLDSIVLDRNYRLKSKKLKVRTQGIPALDENTRERMGAVDGVYALKCVFPSSEHHLVRLAEIYQEEAHSLILDKILAAARFRVLY